VSGIYSKSTCDNYKKWSLKFAEWEREKHFEKQYKILDNIPKEHVAEWIKEGINKGESSYTTRLKAASIAKIMRCHTYDFGIKLPSKTNDRSTLKRSRHNVDYDNHFSYVNNQDKINFCKGTGLRRSELEQIKPQQIYFKGEKLILDFKSQKVYRTMTKGGRGRTIYVLKKYYDVVLQAKENAEKMGQDTVFLKVHHAMDVHSYRAIFAKEKYKEVISDMKNKCATIALDYICRDGSGRRYNKKALKVTSENLGHSRLDVIVKHYF
jgi:integrase